MTRVLSSYTCELCGVFLLTSDNSLKSKFPIKRIYENNAPDGKLLTVRCAECSEIPYWLKEGNPSRSRFFNNPNVHLLRDFSREYHYWSYGIGHLFELYINNADEESLEDYRNSELELGFFVDEETNLIILTHRFLPDEWRITPYQWNYYRKFSRDIPAINPNIELDRLFNTALINELGGKYLIIRNEVLPLRFAKEFHLSIHKQIKRGAPQDPELHRNRIEEVLNLAIDGAIDKMINVRTVLGKK